MRSPFNIELSNFSASNFLWSQTVEKFGFERASKAIRQSIDLQLSNGDCDTLPVIISETCGSALVSRELIVNYFGEKLIEKDTVLLLSAKQKKIQLLNAK